MKKAMKKYQWNGSEKCNEKKKNEMMWRNE